MNRLTYVHVKTGRQNKMTMTVFKSCRYSDEGDFHILHYVQYGLDGVEKFHLRADHSYR